MAIRRLLALVILAVLIISAVLLARAQEIIQSVFLPRACIVSISLADDTTCTGADMAHLVCKGIKLKVIDKCEQIHIERIESAR